MTDPEQPDPRRKEREQTIQRRETISESGVHRTCTVLKVSPCSVQGPEMQMLRVQLQRGNKCFIYFSWSLCL